MPPEPLESSRARGVGPPTSRGARVPGPGARSRHSLPARASATGSALRALPVHERRSESGPQVEGREHQAARPTPEAREEARGEGGSARLEALLRDLGPQISRGAELSPGRGRELDRVHPSGIAALDGLLPGGFPTGLVSELSGPASSGRTAITLALLAETTAVHRELAALVDLADAFDPPSAEAAGVDLDRLLWARPGGPLEALRCAERLMETGGLPLVVLDLSPPSTPAAAHPATRPGLPAQRGRRRRGAVDRAHAGGVSQPALHHWIRLARLADGTRTALVVISRERLTGSQAAFALEAQGLCAPRDEVATSDPLAGPLETRIALVRARGGAADRAVSLRLDTE